MIKFKGKGMKYLSKEQSSIKILFNGIRKIGVWRRDCFEGIVGAP